MGIAAELQPLDAGLGIDVDLLARALPRGVCRRRAGQIECANRHRPAPGADRATAAGHPQRVVLVDETYVDFGGESAVGLIGALPNLLVVHTLSKSRSLAGLRVGRGVRPAALIDALERVGTASTPIRWTVWPRPARAAYEDEAYFEQTCRAVAQSREGCCWRWRIWALWCCPRRPTSSSCATRTMMQPRWRLSCASVQMLVRRFAGLSASPVLRISVRTPAQCDALVQALRELV